MPVMRWFGAVTAAVATAALVGQAQTASRAITVDVAVVDRDGRPIATLTADKFEVEVAGRRRKVSSAAYTGLVTSADGAPTLTYVLAIDALTFGQGASTAVAAVVRQVAAALPAGSHVALATLPSGPSVEVTTDRAPIGPALDGLSGQWQSVSQSSQFGLRAADVIDYLNANDRTPIVQSICTGAAAGMSEQDGCAGLLDQEVAVMVNAYETQARASLGLISGLTSRLAAVPGRKVVVLFTGGLVAADRAGSRPDVGNLPVSIGEAAARGDVTVYAMLLDRRLLDADAVAVRGRQASPARDAEAFGRWADQFSTSVGGAMLRVQGREGDAAYGRLVTETSGRYTLTVEATDADRPGTVQRIRVRVDHRGAIVRTRQVVAVR